MLETLAGCKWSKKILFLITEGITRPGAITRSTEGLTTKVQNDCLRKMLNLGLLERKDFAEIPPRVEYRLTEAGKRFVSILRSIEELQDELETNRKVSKNV